MDYQLKNYGVIEAIDPLYDVLMDSGFFQKGFKLAFKRKQRGQIYFRDLLNNNDWIDIQLLDNIGSYFYIRQDGSLRMNGSGYDKFSSCSNLSGFTWNLYIVAWINSNINPLCAHSILTEKIAGVVPIIETEIDTMSIYWNEVEQHHLEQPEYIPQINMNAIAWRVEVKVDISNDRCVIEDCCN